MLRVRSFGLFTIFICDCFIYIMHCLSTGIVFFIERQAVTMLKLLDMLSVLQNCTLTKCRLSLLRRFAETESKIQLYLRGVGHF